MNAPASPWDDRPFWPARPTLDDARAALAAERFETARRLALAAGDGGDPAARAVVLHDALARLGDLPAAAAALGGAAGFAAALRRHDDLHRATALAGYRVSESAARGLTWEEHQETLRPRREAAAADLVRLATDRDEAEAAMAQLVRTLADHERRLATDQDALAALRARWPAPPAPAPATPAPIAVTCRIRGAPPFPPGSRLTLGSAPEPVRPDPASADTRGFDPEVALPAVATIIAPLAADGTARLDGRLPPGRGFLAVTIPGEDGCPTRFLHRDLDLPADLAGGELTAAWTGDGGEDDERPEDDVPAELAHAGRTWTRLAALAVANPFLHGFPLQDLRLAWPTDPACGSTLVWDGERVLAHQRDEQGRVCCQAALPAGGRLRLGLYAAPGAAPDHGGSLLRIAADGRTAELDTGPARIRIPWGSAADGAAPILAVMGPDRAWRGAGRWDGPGADTAVRTSALLLDGPLLCRVAVAYTFPDGAACTFIFEAHAGSPALRVEERGDARDGTRFALALPEFLHGRGYLHWCQEGEDRHWHDLDPGERELARLQESVPWWIPPAGFAWAGTFDGLDRRDLVAVFSRRRGDWDDPAFAAIAGGPPPGGGELDWPYPEMVGSTISMITVQQTVHGPELRFPRFAGTRHWGLLVSDVARGDGPCKELYQVRHATSFPRLDDLVAWRLDAPDRAERPVVAAERHRLPELRRRIAGGGLAGRLWDRVLAECRQAPHPTLQVRAQACRFAVDGDPATGWLLGRRLAADLPRRARRLLLSRENGDSWSPVGGRMLAPLALAYDAVAASGALSDAERRTVRAALLLAGWMFHSPDLMNWRYGGRNTNFEADRLEAVGAIALAFPGHPATSPLLDHAAGRLAAGIAPYCNPDSGKWYENPACYYLQSLVCRVGLASHLATHGRFDAAAAPRFDRFLGWLLAMLTPPVPAGHDHLRDGCTHDAYAGLPKVRRIAPIGDHAHAGPWVPDAAAVAAGLVRDLDPDLADGLRWAWDQGGRDGGYFGSAALALGALAGEAEDGPAAPPASFASRRLEGFGAVLRGEVGTAREFMLLAKLGPGGYRYHRSEGSFLLVADGRPLVWDGGEAGEGWRHSGITCHAGRIPLAPGRVERVARLPAAEWIQGCHPRALDPGEPVFLSDRCEHTLVAEALRRATLPPAAMRAWLWVRDAYVAVADRLDLPAGTASQWHLQVLADGGTGSPAGGVRFTGRFGTDLQVLLPVGGDRPWSVDTVRLVEHHLPPERQIAQRHLELAAEGPTAWLAILRPLAPGDAPLAAEALRDGQGRPVGARVRGPGIDDHLVLGREPVAVDDGPWRCRAAAAACLDRPDGRRLLLLGPGRVEMDGTWLASDGPAAELDLGPDGPRLVQDGPGRVEWGR